MKKSRVYYFEGKRKVRKDAGFKDKEIQTAPTAIEKANYKTGMYVKDRPISKEEAEAGIKAKDRFLKNVARLLKIMELERKAGEDKLSDAEKLQLIKLDREFEHYEVVAVLEREETEQREFLREQAKTEEPLTNTWKEEAAKDPSDIGEKQGFEGKLRLGGESRGKEANLKAALRRHRKAVGWTEKEHQQKVKVAAGKKGGAVTAAITRKRKKEGKKGFGGRKKGLTFDARVKKYLTKEEIEELDKK